MGSSVRAEAQLRAYFSLDQKQRTRRWVAAGSCGPLVYQEVIRGNQNQDTELSTAVDVAVTRQTAEASPQSEEAPQASASRHPPRLHRQ